MKHVKLFEQYVNEASKKMPNIPLEDWENTGENAGDGQRWAVAEYKGKYYMAFGYLEPGSLSTFSSIDFKYMEEITKKEYEEYI